MAKSHRNQVKRQLRPSQSPNTGASTLPSAGRKWGFRLVAAASLPLAFLCLLELGLRLAGFGYPTSFFLSKEIRGKQVLVENDQFGLRFFPREMARSPSPFVMDAQKGRDVCRIFILGESAAVGDPEPAFGFGRFLQVLLHTRFPNTRFEVVCTAMTAINSHAILPIARECAKHNGDIWVVYVGNNEFVGPFGAGTVFGPQVPPLSAIRFSLAFKKTRIGQLFSKLTASHPDEQTWGGMKMFLDHQVAPSDPRKARVYDYFRANLEDILASAKSGGAKVVLSTVPVNLKDCPPFASTNSDLTPDRKIKWQQDFDSAVQAEAKGDFNSTLSNCQAAAELDSTFAELQFRWGQCAMLFTNLPEAKHRFELARDYDCLPFRADDRLNAVIRECAGKHSADGVRLMDGEAVLAARNPEGIPGHDSFLEHVHLNFDGNYVYARAIAQNIEGLLPESMKTGARSDWATMEDCVDSLALTQWDVHRVFETLLRRLAEPPFVNQIGHAAQMNLLRKAIAGAKARLTREALAQARATYHHAIAVAPDDLYLHAGFAKLEEDNGNLAEAAKQWRIVLDEIPFAPGPHYYLGRVLGAQGQTSEALQQLDAALAIRADLPDALEEKGKLLLKTNRAEEGLKALNEAIRLEPRNARLCIAKAEALATLGRRNEAVQQLERAVQLEPGYWESRYLLGVELAFAEEIQSAAEQFNEAVRLNPDFPLGHLNLGIALAKLSKPELAAAEFQETLRLDPKNQKAAEYLSSLQSSQERRRVKKQ